MNGKTAFVLAGALLAAACGGKDIHDPLCSVVATTSFSVTPVDPISDVASKFDALFQSAGKEFGVSANLLKSVGYIETRWQMIKGSEEFEGRPAAYGVMALRGDRLARGAALAGVSVEAAKTDASANIRAAAALLAADGLEKFSGIEQPEARAAYTRQVYEADGVPGAAVAASPNASNCPSPPAPTVDYTSAVWHASPNFNARATSTISMVIIHTCESNYASCWGWLVDPASQVSAHYVVNENGSEISQLVREKDRAWQIAAYYDCTLNQSYNCAMNGVQMNHFTIGIEHGGFAAQDSFPTSQLQASAKLVCDLTKRQGIPRDSLHIVGHGQMQPNNRTDPGPHWPWHRYIGMVRSYCGES